MILLAFLVAVKNSTYEIAELDAFQKFEYDLIFAWTVGALTSFQLAFNQIFNFWKEETENKYKKSNNTKTDSRLLKKDIRNSNSKVHKNKKKKFALYSKRK